MAEERKPFIMALVGAPGSGKTETAAAFKALIDPYLSEWGLQELAVIDGIDGIIEGEQDRAVGVFGDHFVSMAYYFARQAQIDVAMSQQRPILTCGSLLDNLAHVNARIKLLSQMVQTPETEAFVMREMMAGQMFASYILDGRFRVNFAYHCILPPQILIPGQEKGTFPVEVDEFVRDLKVKMGLDMPVLEGSHEERAAAILANFMESYTG